MSQGEHHESTAKGPDARLVDRMLFFSDAVFAIVLTIMVLELHAPLMETKGLNDAQSAAALWTVLGGMFHIFFAYVLSFALVGLWWSIHMRVTRQLHHFDWPTAIFNFVFLLTVSLIPFASSLLGDNVMNPAAWQIYWGVNAAASIALTVMLLILTRGHGRLIGGMDKRERLSRTIQSIVPGIAFGIGAWLAATGHADMARWCWVLLPLSGLASRFHKAPKAAPATS